MPATNTPPQYCLLNWGRLNAFPLNYTSTQVYGSIGGVPLDPTSQSILIDSLSVSDRLNEEPNTLIATVRGTKPREGQAISVMLGSRNANAPLFAGTILRVTQVWAADNPKNILCHVEATDPTWRLNEILVTARYRSQSASTSAADLLARFAPAGYTAAIEPNLPALDEITFTNTKLMDALGQLAGRIGGYTYCDYTSTVHLWATAEAIVPPAPLVATHPSVAGVQYVRDLTQIVTRAIVQGGGANALARLSPGSTEIPVEDATWYSPSGGLVVSGPQRIQYTGTRAGGEGSLVGSGAAPTSAPSLVPSAGGAVNVGGHYYAYTWVSAAGETLPSPIGAIILDWGPPAAVAPTVGVTEGVGLVAPGTYTYGVTHVTAAGETAVAGSVAAVCTTKTAASTAAPQVVGGSGTTTLGTAGDAVQFRIAYRHIGLSTPATLGPATSYTLVQYPGGYAGTAAGVQVRIWGVTDTGGATCCDIQMQNLTAGGGWRTQLSGVAIPVSPNSVVQPFGNGAFSTAVTETGLPTAVVTVTVQDGGAGVTARRVYRTKKDGSQKYFLREVAGSAQTSFVDTTADSALVTLPPAGVGLMQTVTVSGIAPGPKGTSGTATVARKIYRTAASVAPLQLLATLNNNTTTSYVDTAADAALGAAPPATDTSGLVPDGGQVLPGTVTLPVSGTGAFPTTGGWLLSGNNRIHYTGVSGATLTGIPASGDGAIQNTIPYGTPATLAPSLTGIPASGTGAIVWAILAGDPVDLLVIVDDLAAQATLQTLLGGGATGIREALIQDGRIGLKEASARGTALLKLQSAVLESLTHRSRDPNTVAGALVTINLPAPTSIAGTFRIQDVTVTRFNPHAGIMPTYDAHSSSSRYTLEDLLRQLARTDPPPTSGETP